MLINIFKADIYKKKVGYRSVLTEEHTQQLLVVAVAKDKPDIAAIAAKQSRFHMSH